MTFVLLVLLISFLFVGLIGYLFFFKINISDTKARQIEIAGYLLLIVIAVWVFIVKNVVFEPFYNDNWAFLNEKLKAIFMGISGLYENHITNIDSLSDIIWNMESSEYVKSQLLAVNIVEAVLQVMSAGCIAIGRFQEIKNKNMGNRK